MNRMTASQTNKEGTAPRLLTGGILQRKCDCGQHTIAGGECSSCSKERELPLQRSAINRSASHTPGTVPEVIHEVLRSPGQPLDPDTRAFFEPRFGHDFSRVRTSTSTISRSDLTVGPANDPLEQEADRTADNVLRTPLSTQWPRADFSRVRIHTDARAAKASRAVNARAFTVGHDIVFDSGRYAPGTDAGRKLLAHELAHTIQQSSSETSATARLHRTIGDGHDLQSPRFAGDVVLEACFDGERFLKVGDRGESVKMIQQALIDGGFPLPQFGVDGDFKSETQGAVADFQRAHRLSPDGIIGENTMASLDSVFAGTTPPAAPAPATVPRLSATVNTPPTPGNCGIMNFVINWQLSRNSGPQGGFVIQDITFNWNNRDCANASVPDASGKIPPLRYFEAWRVAPSSTNLSPATTDTFSWINDLPSGCTTDRVTVRATARFHDNVATLPAHMVANNPNTFAGGLRSSLTDPTVGGLISAAVPHSLTFHWNCCPCSANPTVVDSHTP